VKIPNVKTSPSIFLHPFGPGLAPNYSPEHRIIVLLYVHMNSWLG
jgi:hypothetical protein